MIPFINMSINLNGKETLVKRSISDLILELGDNISLELQRKIDPNSKIIQEMYQDMSRKIQNNDELSSFGQFITICKTKSGKSLLIDGQHRYKCHTTIFKNFSQDYYIWICYININDEQEALEIYEKINKRTNVPILETGMSLLIPNKIIDKFNTRLIKKDTFTRTNRPYLCYNIFCESLGNVIRLRPELTEQDIFDKIQEKFQECSTKNSNYFRKKFENKINEKWTDTCRENNFYGGLLQAQDSLWLIRLFTNDEYLLRNHNEEFTINEKITFKENLLKNDNTCFHCNTRICLYNSQTEDEMLYCEKCFTEEYKGKKAKGILNKLFGI